MNEQSKLTPEEVVVVRQRRLEAMHLHTIEGNPLNADDVAMFERFEREQWSFAQRREYLAERSRALASPRR